MNTAVLAQSARPAFRFGASTLFTVLALAALPAFLVVETVFPQPSAIVGLIGRVILFSPVIWAILGLVFAAGSGWIQRRWQYAIEFVVCASVLVLYGTFNLFHLYL